MSISSFIKRIVLTFAYGYSDSDSYSRWLRKKGVTIGEGTKFYSPHTISIDVTRPFGIVIGRNCHITRNVTVLTHGFDWSVTKGLYDDVTGSFGEVIIGDNCFIGSGSTILKGVHIGNNVIVGARSVVTKDLDSNAVYVGNPARFLCTIEDYYEKRIEAQLIEAEELFNCYYRKYHCIPPKKVFSEFFFIFEDRSNPIQGWMKYQMSNNGEYEKCEKKYLEGFRQAFNSYEGFTEYCLLRMKNKGRLNNG